MKTGWGGGRALHERGVIRLLKSEERWEKGLVEEGVTSLMKGEKRGGEEGGLE